MTRGLVISLVFVIVIMGIVSAENVTCIDSDSGKDYYIAGEAIGKDFSNPKNTNYKQVDICNSGQFEGTISEAYCDSRGFVFYSTLECPSGCKDGVCIKSEPFVCLDSDSIDSDGRSNPNLGKDYLEKGMAIGYKDDSLVASTDFCNGSTIVEMYCEGRYLKSEQHFCSMGCVDGFCVPCYGCEVGDKCLKIGERYLDGFCFENNNFIPQRDIGELCENNFECKSNVCVSGECVSEGLIKKILNWFKRLFGGE